MTGVRRVLAALVILLIAMAAARAGAPEHGFLPRTFKGADGQEAKYAVFVPHNYKPGAPVPVILFLHGAGQAGTDGLRNAHRSRLRYIATSTTSACHAHPGSRRTRSVITPHSPEPPGRRRPWRRAGPARR